LAPSWNIFANLMFARKRSSCYQMVSHI
jgi:hypothetical protein